MFVTISVFIISSCNKEDSDVSQKQAKSDPVYSTGTPSSAYLEYDTLIKALGIDSIISDSTSNYTIKFHDDTKDYTVEILHFDIDDSVSLYLEELGGQNSKTMTIDVDNQFISNGSNQVSFSEIDSTGVSSSTGDLLKVTSAMTIHHLLYPNVGMEAADNGSSDSFPAPAHPRCFWCKKSYIDLGPCDAGLGITTQVTESTAFWIFHGTTIEEVPCP